MRWKLIAFLILAGLLVFSATVLFLRKAPAVRGEAYLRQALHCYRLAVRKHPADKQLWQRYEKLLGLLLPTGEVRLELATRYEECGFPGEANPALQELSPQERQELLAALRKRLSQTADLRERTTLSLLLARLSPQDAQAWFNLGKLYLGLGQTEEAIGALEKALSCGLQEPEVYYYLAVSYREAGRLEQAEATAKSGLARKDEVNLHRVLLDLYRRRGQKQLALQEQARIKDLLAKLTVPERPRAVPEEKEKPARVPTGLSPYTFLMVSKTEQKLSVCRYDVKNLEILQTYPCTTGKNSGQKEKPGDGRTPEGCFLLSQKIDGSRLPAKYGLGAYTLEYPCVVDRMAGRSGNGIWLHGTPIERPPYNSEGCIVLNDKDFSAVSGFIQPGRTFLYVAEKPAVGDLQSALEAVHNWKKDWESLKIDVR